MARYETGVCSPAVNTLTRLLRACGQELILESVDAAGASDLSGPQAQRLRQCRGLILRTCARYGARNLRIFGSAARGDARTDSDIDLLCDLDVARDLVDLAALRSELTELLGMRVDISTPRLLKPEVLAAALAEGIPL